MTELVRDSRTALLLLTRDLGIIAHYAERVAVLHEGRIVEEQPVKTFFSHPTHEHSEFLLDASFAARGRSTFQ